MQPTKKNGQNMDGGKTMEARMNHVESRGREWRKPSGEASKESGQQEEGG